MPVFDKSSMPDLLREPRPPESRPAFEIISSPGLSLDQSDAGISSQVIAIAIRPPFE